MDSRPGLPDLSAPTHSHTALLLADGETEAPRSTVPSWLFLELTSSAWFATCLLTGTPLKEKPLFMEIEYVLGFAG